MASMVSWVTSIVLPAILSLIVFPFTLRSLLRRPGADRRRFGSTAVRLRLSGNPFVASLLRPLYYMRRKVPKKDLTWAKSADIL